MAIHIERGNHKKDKGIAASDVDGKNKVVAAKNATDVIVYKGGRENEKSKGVNVVSAVTDLLNGLEAMVITAIATKISHVEILWPRNPLPKQIVAISIIAVIGKTKEVRTFYS